MTGYYYLVLESILFVFSKVAINDNLPIFGLGILAKNTYDTLSDQKYIYHFEKYSNAQPQKVCLDKLVAQIISGGANSAIQDKKLFPNNPVLMVLRMGVEFFNVKHNYQSCMSQADEYLESTNNSQDPSICNGELGTCTQDSL